MQTSQQFTPIDGHAMLVLKVAVAFCVAQWVATPLAIRFLVILMAIDILTGLIAAYMNKTLSSNDSFRGMLKKVLILILVTVAELVSINTEAIGLDPGLHIGRICTIFYTISELISIIENCSRAGVPIPLNLMAALAKVKDSPIFQQKLLSKSPSTDDQQKAS